MKKNDWIYFAAITILLTGTIVAAIVKFILPRNNQDNILSESVRKITVVDLSENPHNLSKLLDEKKYTFCLIFELNNCYSCIYKGIEDLKAMKNSGEQCFAIVVHDFLDELRGWSTNYQFSPFFMLNRKNFYVTFNIKNLPVIVKFKGEKVIGLRYITP